MQERDSSGRDGRVQEGGHNGHGARDAEDGDVPLVEGRPDGASGNASALSLVGFPDSIAGKWLQFITVIVALVSWLSSSIVELVQAAQPASRVEIETSFNEVPHAQSVKDVISPAIFYGNTLLTDREELWVIVKPPQDTKSCKRADRESLFVVGHKEAVTANVQDTVRDWSVKIDLGNEAGDVGKTYQVIVWRSKPSEGNKGRSEISLAQEENAYPKFDHIPDDSQEIGRVQVKLEEYEGEHQCPVRPPSVSRGF